MSVCACVCAELCRAGVPLDQKDKGLCVALTALNKPHRSLRRVYCVRVRGEGEREEE